ncbi:hypothetical protein QQ008_03815 [Fulvivirgaceae bacterium BMA10]|uniref:Uncharacterized protein n=1 Tax=Splendidivirga corallicola TaxID=3051826 RepID=A0ABT8KIB7_9BACT|nr:hypothetical protein [Fulvivirgaceae bacterium BMA10]
MRKNDASRKTVSYTEAKNIGILFTIENREKHEKVKSLIKTLKEDGKTVDVLCLLLPGKENYDFTFDYFTPKDFSFFGQVTSELVASFNDKEFDYLIYLDIQPDIFAENILANCRAKCRIGKFVNEQKSPFYELMIKTQETQDLQLFINEVYHYLKVLS